nr:translation initiation factor IF-2 [Bacilli bacterium]
MNMSSKEIITILGRLNIPVNNHMSVMEAEMVAAVEGFFSDVKARAAARTMEQERKGNDEKTKIATPTVPKPEATTEEKVVKVKEELPQTVSQSVSQGVVSVGMSQERTHQPKSDSGIIGARSTQDQRNRRPSSQNQGQGHSQGQGQNRTGQQNQQRPYPPRQTNGQNRDQQAPRSGGYASNGQSGTDRRPHDGSSPRPQSSQQGNYQGGQRRPDSNNRPNNDQRSANDANRRPRPNNDRRPDQRFASSSPAGTNSSNRFGAPAPASSTPSNNANSTRRRTNERSDNNRGFDREKRENNRKIQPPRSRHTAPSNFVKAPEGPKQVTVDAPMTVGEFARLIRREVSDVIKKLLFLGMPATINQEIDTDTMVLIGAEYSTEVQVEAPRDLEAEEMLVEEVDEATLETRAPVVTIMGHVDHGKTTLLDAIRESNVIASEAGGITQHIGAYQVEVHKKKITFLDTPGHAAFTTMRARGAQITDITVLVVAADDGVMPQTIEAIAHAKAANVPIIVAVNKMDKPGANPDRVKQELTEHGLVAEEWGGDTIFVPISAKQRKGIEELLEMILLVAEVADLKASVTARSRGTVIEAELDRGRGPVATVLVQNGMLHVGDVVVAGNTFGRVRAMVNDRGRRVKEASPSAPVEIVGLGDVPSAGDPFVVYDDERQARQVAERRAMRQRAEELGATSRVTLDDLYKRIQEGEIKDLNIILKADVHGSAEAVLGALNKIDISGVRVRVIHSGVGAITESDILLASASKAIVIGFNVRPEPNAAKMAESEKIDLRLYRVIYNVIEEIESALKGMLDPEFKEVVLGRAEVRQLFKVSKVGTIAGCLVQEGKIVRDAEIRVIRAGVIVFEGKLDSLKRFKDDAKEVASGYECGITVERFNDLKEGDIIEAFKMEAIKTE